MQAGFTMRAALVEDKLSSTLDDKDFFSSEMQSPPPTALLEHSGADALAWPPTAVTHFPLCLCCENPESCDACLPVLSCNLTDRMSWFWLVKLRQTSPRRTYCRRVQQPAFSSVLWLTPVPLRQGLKGIRAPMASMDCGPA